jgi:hypothetical protein
MDSRKGFGNKMIKTNFNLFIKAYIESPQSFILYPWGFDINTDAGRLAYKFDFISALQYHYWLKKGK